MCGGVSYRYNGDDYRHYFPNPQATLPVQLKNGTLMLLPWGRRKEQAGQLPAGGWARLDSIYAGRWNRYSPTPVKIKVSEFMEKDLERNSHWFDIKPEQWIQGLIAHKGGEQRIYVVTVESESETAIHNRWPRLLSG